MVGTGKVIAKAKYVSQTIAHFVEVIALVPVLAIWLISEEWKERRAIGHVRFRCGACFNLRHSSYRKGPKNGRWWERQLSLIAASSRTRKCPYCTLLSDIVEAYTDIEIDTYLKSHPYRRRGILGDNWDAAPYVVILLDMVSIKTSERGSVMVALGKQDKNRDSCTQHYLTLVVHNLEPGKRQFHCLRYLIECQKDSSQSPGFC